MEKYLKPIESGVCMICGCTDQDCTICIINTGGPCYWVNNDQTFCSACESRNRDMKFLSFLRLDIKGAGFFSAMWFELEMGVDYYLSKNIHQRINGKVDHEYLIKPNIL
ncbi:hypothetical protein [Sphingobacterium siyangense]|uniref:hypothetical protein n=1 Tax=Sphingobacterium siyangense TaxID=459529 RepID=UPI003DA3D65F